MKKLKLTIAGEVMTFNLPENGEYKCEVEKLYVPKVGDCVRVSGNNLESATFFKIVFINNKGNIKFNHCVDLDEGKCIIDLTEFWFAEAIDFTQITPEELKAKYAEAGYDWDYESDTVKPLKWMPKVGDFVWYISDDLTVANGFYNEDFYYLLEKGLLFPTEAECQKFADHCLKYFDKK